MANAQQLFEQGDLPGAIAALTGEVKAAPADTRRRTFLFELLAFSGELDRAERQLDVVAHEEAMAEPAVQVYRNILHAERQRRRVFTEGLKPEFLQTPPEYTRFHLEAVNCLRAARTDEACALLERSADERPALRGKLDGVPFDDLRDCDDVIAPFLEFILIRDYVWVPFEHIRELEIARPERPRDLLWAPVRLVLPDGTQRRGYAPVLYPDSSRHADDAVKLGRMTVWNEDGGLVRGQGQRVLLVGEDGRPFLEARSFEIEPPG